MTNGAARVGPAFAAALAADRDLFNQKFAEARRRRPDLDAAAFGEFLCTLASPLVEAAAGVNPSRAQEIAHAAYDAALTLVSERLAGSGGRHPDIDALFARLLPKLAGLVADQPARVIGSLANAVFNLCATPGARPGQFVERLEAVAEFLPSVGDLLRAGELAAWRAGLAHFRAAALAAGDALPSRVAAEILGAPKLEWSELRARLAEDPWWDPSLATPARAPRVAAVVGAFRGFGGLFLGPPRVGVADGHFVVAESGQNWLLAADAFGATFSRTDENAAQSLDPGAVRLPLELPSIGVITSAATLGTTLAVTGDATHQVTLIAT
jgi:hypothetical protein